MLTISPFPFIEFLQGFSSETLSGFLFLACVGSILILLRGLGAAGIYVYIALATTVANIQVLTASYFYGFSTPVALGTVVFASTYLATDILTEYYGNKAARQGVWVGFASMVMMIVFMAFTLGFQPPSDPLYKEFITAHGAMQTLFLPAPAIFLASIIAYLTSQYNDIWIFGLIKKATKGKHLWLRTSLSTIVSAFIDNIIFSVLAWMVFAPTPKPFQIVWWGYILGTFSIRIVIGLASTPIIYLARPFIATNPK